jgi:hypothetical protein
MITLRLRIQNDSKVNLCPISFSLIVNLVAFAMRIYTENLPLHNVYSSLRFIL